MRMHVVDCENGTPMMGVTGRMSLDVTGCHWMSLAETTQDTHFIAGWAFYATGE
jgi:hypothetical protein